MSDDKYITVPVRVPADLEVDRSEPSWVRLSHGKWACSYEVNDTNWHSGVLKAIAAAVEARKPPPPKFVPGDIVEWVSAIGTQQVGIIKEPAEPLVYWLTDGITRVHEDRLKLVRRAEK